jgi:hypothetical protein
MARFLKSSELSVVLGELAIYTTVPKETKIKVEPISTSSGNSVKITEKVLDVKKVLLRRMPVTVAFCAKKVKGGGLINALDSEKTLMNRVRELISTLYVGYQGRLDFEMPTVDELQTSIQNM